MFSSKDLFFTTPAGGYQIAKSLRFRSSASAYLNRTPASAGNQKTWTISFWVKRGKLSYNVAEIMGCYSSSTDTGNFEVRFTNSDTFQVVLWNYLATTNAVFRDPSAWYHCVLVLDTTQAGTSSGSKIKLYVNGVLQSWSSDTISSSVAQNTNLIWNSTTAQYLARWYASDGGGYYFDGYLADINFIDGQALTPSSFGETDATTGVWKPKAYTGTYGTNGFYLKFADNSGATATTIGKDSSGNGNNWTPTNISVTAGTTYDSMIDTPTPYDDGGNGVGNYPVLNAVKKNDSGYTTSITAANLDVAITYSSGANMVTVPATMATPTTGKWYFEVVATSTMPSGGATGVGITDAATFTDGVNPPTNCFMYVGASGNKFTNGTTTAYGSTYTTNDVIGVAIDLTNGAIYFAKNNTWQNSGDPTSGATKTGAAYTTLTATPYFPYVSSNASGTRSFSINFGQRPFTYTPPSGFKALNTYNLPTPTIAAGNKYFDATTYTGNGSTQSVVNSGGFQPDLVWAKSRGQAYSHVLEDAVRGIGKALYSNATNAEDTPNYYMSAFNSNGFTVTSSPGVAINQNNDPLVAWQWKANGSGSSNTSGSITSTVSANATAGFSVVTYGGNSTAGATVGHGLGVAPSMIIVKNRTASSGYLNWCVYHQSVGNTQALYLNTTNAATTDIYNWNNTSPTSSVFSLGYSAGNGTNISGQNYVAYCFAAVAGYSAFGSYTGNGSADGPFIYTGFRPRYVMIKCSSTGGAGYDWFMWDSSRNTYNVVDHALWANLSAAENTATMVDLVSNGFKIRLTSSSVNASSATFIYAAFAENPFKYALAR